MEPQQEKAKKDFRYAFNLTIAAVAGQVGCLTSLIIVFALFGGLWLDSKFNTRPMFTIGLIVGSIPITLMAMLWIVRSATSRLKIKDNTKSPVNIEEG